MGEVPETKEAQFLTPLSQQAEGGLEAPREGQGEISVTNEGDGI